MNVTLSSCVPAVGTIATPITFPADSSGATTTFHPLTPGATNLVITTPTG